MSRYIDADALLSKGPFVVRMNDWGEYFVTVDEINKMPTVDAVPVVRCKECKYRPYWDEETSSAMFPIQGRCPCECDDDFYSWVPDDNWFCADGKGDRND